jgi:hypothetical protein
MRRVRPMLALAAASLGLLTTPAAPARTAAAHQYLDRHSGATITTMGRPFIFARERPSLAVNARDYISLVAIDINRGGQHKLYWYGYAWSTIDHREGNLASQDAPGWLLLADGRPITLQTTGETPQQLGIAHPPLAAPARDAKLIMFLADREPLSYVAAATGLSLQRPDGSDVFSLWRDARGELRAFLQRSER